MTRRHFLAQLPLAAAAPAFARQIPPRLRAAQIGTRHSHATGKMEAMRKLAEHYEVAGICETDAASRQRAEKAKAYEGLRWLEEAELLADASIQVVAVETALDHATATALRCLEAGKHVHLDKPGGADPAAFAAMRRRAEERGLLVQMGYMLRYNPAFELLFRAGREGWFGEVLEINATMGKLADPGMRRTLSAHPGHGMFELACHLVDAVVTLLGPPAKVTPFATHRAGDPLADNQLAILEYPRALAVLRCNHADPGGGPRRAFEVVGSEGSMLIAPLESGRMRLSLTKPRGEYAKGDHALALTLPGGRYDSEFYDLARSVRREKPFAWGAAHDIAVHETALRAAGV